ncbi:MAG: VOC family protein, partial [Pseudomonadota bacterium]|nr:VOC family protein [Pseudomonadota bacterium]
MIGYVTVGTSDLERAARFYDPLAAELGVGRMMEFDSFISWGDVEGARGIAATMPFDGKPASVGNGTMVALEAKDRAQVQRLYDIALANGGSDEGAPGPRGEPDDN